jgi:hypothetical protein
MATRRFLAGLLFLAACRPQSAPPPTPAPAAGPPPQSAPRTGAAARPVMDGAALLVAMHERYPKWYRTLTFVQKTTIYRPGGELVQTWFAAAALPGRLRIDTDSSSNPGQLFARDSVFAFANGRLARAGAGVNELLVLGFDVYTQPPARTAQQLASLGFDLSRTHETTWQGKRVLVVGAAAGDTTTKQFWVDRDNLLFVRSIASTPRGRTDVRFDRYERIGSGWIAKEVLQLVNGRPTLREEYSDVRVDVPLSDALFDPSQWSSAPRWFIKPAGRF